MGRFKALRGIAVAACVAAGLLTVANGVASAAPIYLCLSEKAGPAKSGGVEGKCPAPTAKVKYAKVALPSDEAEQQKLLAILPYIKYVASGVGGKPTIQVSGANLQVTSGASEGLVNGVGNLIVGADESPRTQTGSNNLVLGGGQEYTSYGSLIAGYGNTASGVFNAVFGVENTASGAWASVSGGKGGSAQGIASSVTGGYKNTASGSVSAVTGGNGNKAEALESVISGGVENITKGFWSSVSGGFENTASGEDASVSGGQRNVASGNNASVVGGYKGTAAKQYSSILAGKALETLVEYEGII